MDAFVKVFGGVILVVGGLFLAMCLGPLFGWIVGITPIGSWVAQGGHALGLNFAQGDIWALGAFLGFFTPGFRSHLKTEK